MLVAIDIARARNGALLEPPGHKRRRRCSVLNNRLSMTDSAEPDVLAYMSFPKEHRAKRQSTNPIERINGEIKRRIDVVGIFPNDDAYGGSSAHIPKGELYE